ncbi:MAG: HAD hydrolase-like protein, partial [Pseudomonadota bacterium]
SKTGPNIEGIEPLVIRAFDILAIGDGPATDIKGANNQGLDALYVGTGLAQYDDAEFLAGTSHLLSEHGVTAKYIQQALRW